MALKEKMWNRKPELNGLVTKANNVIFPEKYYFAWITYGKIRFDSDTSILRFLNSLNARYFLLEITLTL